MSKISESKEILLAHQDGNAADLSGFALRRLAGTVPYITKALAGDQRQRSFVWSDGSVDRDNDTIRPQGWKLAQFKKNGMILWAHDRTMLPIGTPKNFKLDKTETNVRLVGDVVFSEANPFAEIVLRLIDEKVIKNVSVGFRPIKWVLNEERGGVDFLEQELLEGSIVPVGSNPNAMAAVVRAAGLNGSCVREWAEKILDMDDTDNRVEVEQIHKAFRGWAPQKRVSDLMIIAEEVESKEVESKEVESKEVESKEVESKEVESKEVESKEAESKEVESKEAESKEVESKEVESKELFERMVQAVKEGQLKRDFFQRVLDATEQPPQPLARDEIKSLILEAVEEFRQENKKIPATRADVFDIVRGMVSDHIADMYQAAGRLPL